MNNDLIKEFTTLQDALRPQITLKNSFTLDDLQWVAGIDLAYWQEGDQELATCNIVVFDFHSKKVIESVEHVATITVPYIAGFLAFRELPLIIEASKKLHHSPDLYMFDGNGYLHARHMDIATHASFHLNKPTIGVAKNYLKIGDTDFIMPSTEQGAYTDIVINDEVYGRCLRSRDNVKPIFVSCGNWIDLETATQITLHFVNKESRLPITTRYADLETHKSRKTQLSEAP